MNRNHPLPLRQLAAAVLLGGCFTTTAQAAGGHFAVDDAEILAPDTCKLDGWVSRGADERLLHLGGDCRLGPVELGVSGEREGSETTWGVGAKWAREVHDRLGVAASIGSSWQVDADPRHASIAIAGLVSFRATDDWRLHANLGRDLVRGAPDQGFGGISSEWRFLAQWTLVAERYRQDGGQFARAGLRWDASPGWRVDFSRALRLSGPGESFWTVAFSREFAAP